MNVLPVPISDGKILYAILDDDGTVIRPVSKYIKNRLYPPESVSPYTAKNCAYRLLQFYRYCKYAGYDPLQIGTDNGYGLTDILAQYGAHLQYSDEAWERLELTKEFQTRNDETISAIVFEAFNYIRYLAYNQYIPMNELLSMELDNRKTYSYLRGLVKSTPADGRGINIHRKGPTYDKKPLEYVTRDQVLSLYGACNNDRDRLLVRMLFESGLRIGEALSIRLEDLRDIQDNIVYVQFRDDNANGARVKYCANRSVMYMDDVISDMMNYLTKDRCKYPGDMLFINLYRGECGSPMKYSNAYDLFSRLSKKTGIEVHPHMLRHGFATEKMEWAVDEMLSKGFDNGKPQQDIWTIEKIRDYLGHRQTSTTDKYTHFWSRLLMDRNRAKTMLDPTKHYRKEGK